MPLWETILSSALVTHPAVRCAFVLLALPATQCMRPLLLLAIPASPAIITQPLGHLPAQEPFRLTTSASSAHGYSAPGALPTGALRVLFLSVTDRKKPALPGR